MKAYELINELNKGGSAGEITCDTIKSGSPDTELKKVAVTMFATVDTVKAVKEWGADMMVVHEPTYYDHMDVMIDTGSFVYTLTNKQDKGNVYKTVNIFRLNNSALLSFTFIY